MRHRKEGGAVHDSWLCSELLGSPPPRAEQQQQQSVLARLPPSAQASFRAKFRQLPSHQQQFVFNKLTTASPHIQVARGSLIVNELKGFSFSGVWHSTNIEDEH